MANQKYIAAAVLLAMIVFTAPARADLIAGWHSFPVNGSYASVGAAKPADVTVSGFTGTVWGAAQSRNTWSSTDGFYGSSSYAVPSGATINGAMAIRTNLNNLDVTITNNTGKDYTLNSLLFDVGGMTSTAPDTITLSYLSGDLNNTNGAVVNSYTGLLSLPTTSFTDDWNDFSWSLAGLSDRILSTGQSATFRFTVANATNSAQSLGIDNIAFDAVLTPEPASIALWSVAGVAVLALGVFRRRLRGK